MYGFRSGCLHSYVIVRLITLVLLFERHRHFRSVHSSKSKSNFGCIFANTIDRLSLFVSDHLQFINRGCHESLELGNIK